MQLILFFGVKNSYYFYEFLFVPRKYSFFFYLSDLLDVLICLYYLVVVWNLFDDALLEMAILKGTPHAFYSLDSY